MSGTSVDSIDAALVELSDDQCSLLANHSEPLPETIQAEIRELSTPTDNEIDRLGVLDRQLGELFATATHNLLQHSGTSASQVSAIGSHGQTIRHRPPSGLTGAKPFTLQIADPNVIAERTGMTTVADFRRRDMAAGGEAAPLAPAFHDAMFRHPARSRAIVNIGGIANVTLLNTDPVVGFDTGPGNGLMDAWIQQHKQLAYDDQGNWAASGKVNSQLLQTLNQHPYLGLSPPKSTGKEVFNLSLLPQDMAQELAAQDIQATLAEWTATTIADALSDQAEEVFVCGGGAHNRHLLARLEQLLQLPVASTDALGIHPDWVEAAAFAWLAARCLDSSTGNLPSVTGASGSRILGAIHQA